MILLAYSLSIIFGYALAKFFTPILPSIKTKNLHIHHWIWSTCLLLPLFYFGLENEYLIGSLTGIALQGLSYQNWSILKKERASKFGVWK